MPARIIHAAARDPITGETLDRSPLWSAEVNGELIAEPSPDWVAAGVDRIWSSGRVIDLAEYRYLTARRDHAVRYEPSLPEANPRQPIDHLRTPTPF